MLEGIQILNETVKWTAGIEAIIGLIGFGLLAIFVLILTIQIIRDEEIFLGILCVVCSLCVGVLSFTFGFNYFTRTQYKEYQVTISNSVNFNEFNKKYEIIRQEGKIYTIIKKEGE